jgi:5'-nucleotidase
MRVLLVNDDGVYAPGIKALKSGLESTGKYDVYTVAPLEERSTTGHTLTLDSTLRVQQIDEKTYGCSGYPADCTLIGIGHLLKQIAPDVIISGINRGANLAQDIYYSGTCAAAREAAFHGYKSIAVSTVLNLSKVPDQIYFETAAEYICHFLEQNLLDHIDPLTMLNINVPNVPFNELKGDEITFLGRRLYSEKIDKRTDFRGRPYYWLVGEFHGNEEIQGSDCFACDSGKVSISPLDILNRYENLQEKWKGLIKPLI